jgi:hypothetical protein
MAYIGNAPVSGLFKKLDSISSSFNGVLLTFPLTSSTVAVIAGSAQNVLISISGVLREPGSSYNISGTNIVFTQAPLSTDTFFGVLLGAVGEINTVSDGAITGPKLAALVVTSDKIADLNITAAKLAVGSVVSNIGFTPYNATNPSGYITGAANTFTGTQTGNDNILNTWLLRDTALVYLDKGTVGTGTVTFSYTNGSCQRLQVSGALTIALSNFPPTGNLGVMQLELVNAGSAAVVFPVINWVQLDGTFTTSIATYLANISRNALQTTGTDFVMLWSRNAGTTVYGKLL